MPQSSLTRYAWLSIAAALATILLKGAAWHWTGSVGLLSDALESFVNLAGALMALWMLTLSAQPADDKHSYGHGKAEYFASGFEGLLILLAAFGIGQAAILRLLAPQPLEQVGIGLAVSVLASLINLGVARVLLAAGKRHASVALGADGAHLMTDVWTSVGIIAGVAAVALTGWLWLDPVLALAVAIHILYTGWTLVREAAAGLMDAALPESALQALEQSLTPYRAMGIGFHAIRTRQSGNRAFISLHVLVPGHWTVQQAHELAEWVEESIRQAVSGAHVTTHLEPLEDPVSHQDIDLDRA
ncbi:transporter [Azospira sp. I13]|uniref:cation diffusion facilitator family transporter n=1 Tax=Azospira sp. I13 TaxID=1765050 RepID=UPI000D4FC47C|nr:cation diffusion facilitator family transporter [Azospira sp. I13]GBG03202.1 transporter [Azospira sp. I13]